ncbi:MAG: hypothetical protein FJW39_18340 [Acidobacteria bacterium]|nr:hypothetical protein [Acidobacteriota bacterium]
MTRREFAWTAAAPLAAQSQPGAGVRHILPGASHERFLLKMSFHQAVQQAPVLRVGSRKVTGVRTDSAGQFWMFDVPGLEPATPYSLQIVARGKAVTEPWTLRTMPAPDSRVERFRLLIYTCAGGHDAMRRGETNDPYWVSIPLRRKIFAAALKEKPDAAVAIGDNVYWDLRFGRGVGANRPPMGAQPWARALMGGDFDRDIPVIGTPNEAKLKAAVDRQIADLYGTLFQSVPMHFIQDDHDYFENDEAVAQGISFPPDDFMMRLARATQHLYFPEHLPHPSRPVGLPGASAGDRAAGLSECYGTLRWGSAAELLLYDCRRYQTLRGPHARLVPENVEAWLARRMKESDARHVVHVPSMPVAWSAGKWGEWYADVLDNQGRLGVANTKYFWQEGWRLQHDRLLAAASGMARIPVFMSGDLHALAHGAIERNGKHDLRRNPVHSVLTGPVSTGPWGWPSSARGTPPLLATGMEVKESLKPLEQNGFTIVDFVGDRIEFRQFKWKMGEAEANLDQMQPFHEFRLERKV